MQNLVAHQEDVKKKKIDYIKKQAINQYKMFNKEQVERQKQYIKTKRKYN